MRSSRTFLILALILAGSGHAHGRASLPDASIGVPVQTRNGLGPSEPGTSPKQRASTATQDPATISAPPATLDPGSAVASRPTQPTIATAIQAYLNNTVRDPALARPADGSLRRFYSARQNAPAWWTGDAGWSPRAIAALDTLRDADADGLSPTAYNTAALSQLLKGAVPGTNVVADPSRVATADMALSAAVLRYIRDVTGGNLDPNQFGWKIPWEYADPAQLLATGLAAPDMRAWSAQLRPQNQAYSGLRKLLARYRALAQQPWAPLAQGPTLRPGDRDPRVDRLRANLTMLGDLAAPEVPSAERQHRLVHLASTASNAGFAEPGLAPIGGPVYEGPVVQAVQRFQLRHGLNPDGIVGPRTLAALNVSPDQRVRQIRANMQRLRWMPREFPPRFIVVNLPAYRLQAVENGQAKLSMRVVAGQPDWPTPIIADWVVNLKFAPTWTIPRKIARTETLPKIKADPSYLDRQALDVLINGRRVNPHTIDWSALNASNFPYTLRQRPGKENALGLIRFSLTNPYAIYMHDTSNPAAFARWGRSISHGCVRVERPAELAAFVLNDPAWPPERIQRVMNEAHPHIMSVPDPVAVYMVYFTAWRGDKGEAQFREDIYNRDEALAAAL